jgi:organic hydroperoxide reductase OsmC/OhrA
MAGHGVAHDPQADERNLVALRHRRSSHAAAASYAAGGGAGKAPANLQEFYPRTAERITLSPRERASTSWVPVVLLGTRCLAGLRGLSFLFRAGQHPDRRRYEMSRSHSYRTRLRWSGASAGAAKTYDGYSREWTAHIEGKPPLLGSADPTFRGDPALYNPEDLLLIALASCHMLSFLALATRARLVVTGYVDEAEGTMLFEGGGGRFTEVMLRPRVTVAPGADLALSERLHEQAHQVCFIAASVNFPVRHDARMEIGAPAG